MTEASGHLVADRYRLIEPGAQDGMGRVWRGYDQQLDREVAVREFYLPLGVAPDLQDHMVKLMTREAQVAARLHHPGIVAILDAVEDDGRPWIITEFISGPSLHEVVAREGPMAWDKVVRIGADLAGALAYAHAAGIMHGDLDPFRVLLAGDRPVIADFGLTRLLDVYYQETGADTLVGALICQPPERLQGQPAQAPADLWGLGLILYFALEGRRPFEREEPVGTILAILREPLSSPLSAGPLAPIIEGLMAKAPEQRPDAPTAAARLAALRGH